MGFLDHGLFAEKLPRCFTSAGLSKHISQSLAKILPIQTKSGLRKLLTKHIHGDIRHEALRPTKEPRPLGIPHPESYIVQVLTIERSWKEIVAHCAEPELPVSQIFVRRIRKSPRIFEMNYKGPWSDRLQDEDRTLERMAAATLRVKADIVQCFPSIYTHSIPWAAHSQSVAKKRRDDVLLWGNALDRATQGVRDGQTNGLPIGPRTSNLISEILLTKVDQILLSEGYRAFERHIDNYTFYARDRAQADEFLRALAQALRAFDLTMHEVEVLELPLPLEEDWVSQLNAFPLHTRKKNRRKRRYIRTLLDTAVSLARRTGNAATINYAFKMVKADLSPEGRKFFVRQAMNLALHYPYLVPIMEEHVFQRHRYDGIKLDVGEFSNRLLRISLSKSYPSTVCHALYLALKDGARLRPLHGKHAEVVAREIETMNDCLCLVLLYLYARRHRLDKTRKRIVRRSAALRNLSREDQDRFWLLIYQTSISRTLKDSGQEFLAHLKSQRFSFVNL